MDPESGPLREEQRRVGVLGWDTDVSYFVGGEELSLLSFDPPINAQERPPFSARLPVPTNETTTNQDLERVSLGSHCLLMGPEKVEDDEELVNTEVLQTPTRKSLRRQKKIEDLRNVLGGNLESGQSQTGTASMHTSEQGIAQDNSSAVPSPNLSLFQGPYSPKRVRDHTKDEGLPQTPVKKRRITPPSYSTPRSPPGAPLRVRKLTNWQPWE